MDGFDLILSPSLPALPERTAGRIFEAAGDYRRGGCIDDFDMGDDNGDS